jgi:RNase H-like domain found in reverse transcriptase/Reverse transcriptase (RNA-dependent DNA polymerase)/Integrase zinc binding domain/Chromo (CHRromatin Organisation MOdifier) domain/Retroviral aspartyl protease
MQIEPYLQHYLAHRAKAPVNSSACFIVPKWDWIEQRMQQEGFELVREYPAGTAPLQVQTAAGSLHAAQVPWALQAFYQPPQRKVQLRCMGSEQKESHIMTFKGQISHAPAAIMVDSGASCAGTAHGFITDRMVTKLGLTTLETPVQWVNLASGANSSVKGAVSVCMRMGQGSWHYKQRNLRLLIMPDGLTGVDVILATDWLAAVKASQNWNNNTLVIRNGNADVVLTPEYAKDNSGSAQGTLAFATTILAGVTTPEVLSAKQTAKLITRGARAFMLVVKEEAADSSVQLASVQADTEMVDAKDELKVKLQALLKKYEKVFDPVGHFDTLPQIDAEHLIPIDPNIPYKGHKHMYRLSPREQEEVKKQVAHLLSLGMIEPSTSPYGAPVLFAEKADGTLRMCVDYRALNKITIKDRYPMPNIQDIFDSLHGAEYFSSLDLQCGYNQIRISEKDRPLTAFLVPGAQWQYKVLCFGLANAPASYQRITSRLYHDQLGKSVLVYQDDILIYSKTAHEHLQHLEEALQILEKHNLKAKMSKCHFLQSEVKYLGHIVGREGIKVDPEKVKVVKEWPQPQNIHKLRQFLGLANYFRRFIRNYSSIAAPLTRLTGATVPYEWTMACQEAFELIKHALTNAPILKLPDPDKPYEVWSDASITGCGGVLLQEHKPIAYSSRKFTPAEVNYSTTDQECLGIVNAMQEWRPYLEGAKGVKVYTDHNPLTYLQDQQRTNLLSRRQARWMTELSRFPFEIEYKKGKTNIADALSRLHESVRLAAVTVSVTNPIRERLLEAYAKDPAFRTERRTCKKEPDGFWYTPQGLVLVPNDPALRTYIMAQYHDHAYAGHKGAKRMTEAITRTYTWPGVSQDAAKYVASCDQCQRNKASTSKPGGLLQPLPPPERPWGSVSLDFIGPLPETDKGNDSILVFVDRLTKMTRLCATRTTCTAKDVADLFIDRVFSVGHGLPDSFVSDRDGRFTGHFWTEFLDHLRIRKCMSTAFHPQTDGQTERMNRLVEETLRHYVNPTQTDWDEHLPLVEFAINDAKNASTGTTPFKLNYVWEPKVPMTVGLPQQQGKSKCDAAQQYVEEMKLRIQRAKSLLNAAQQRQKQYADTKRREVTYKAGDKVLLDSRNLKFKGPGLEDKAKNRGKLMPRFVGPYEIKQMHGPVAVELVLPKSMTKRRIHPTFHVSLVKPYTGRAGEDMPDAPEPLLADDGEIYYEIDKIVNHRISKKGKKNIREFMIQWKGYSPEHNTWEKETELREQDLVAQDIDKYLIQHNLPRVVK